MLRVGSTFSGVGGADLGLERAGFELAWTCEWDEWKRSVLAAHWPDVPHYHDVRDVADLVSSVRNEAATDGVHAQSGGRSQPEASDVAPVFAEPNESGAQPRPQHAPTRDDGMPDLRVELLVGGFPCQDLSVAGKRRGFDGERSVLAFEFLRIAESIRPRWLLMENVPGLLSSNGGRDLARLLDELGAIGYGWAYRVLDARYFSVPQRRRRVFICARRADAEFDTRAAAGFALRALWEGSGGDSTPGWPPQKIIATRAGASAQSGGSVGVNGAASEAISNAVTRKWSKGTGGPAGDECQNLVTQPVVDVASTLQGSGGSPRGHRNDAESAAGGHLIPQTAHTLTSVGHDASEDGTGRGTPIVPEHMSVRRLTPVECERLMGWPDNWTAPPGVKAPDSKRYAACGDGIVSWVAYWIGCRIRMIEEEAA